MWPYVTCAVAILLAVVLVVGCRGIFYKDTVSPSGLVNLHEFGPGMIRVGHPTTAAQWTALREELMAQPGDNVRMPLFVQLHFDYEADDAPFANASTGWELLKFPLKPEDGKPWTVVESSPPSDVLKPVRAILAAHDRGQRVAWGCMADRDRGSLVSALVGMVLYAWTEEEAWKYMQSTGSRIAVLPGLLDSFLDAAPDLQERAQSHK